MAAHLQRHAPDQGQVFRGMILASPMVIFPVLEVWDPMLPVLNAPVAADPVGKACQVGERAPVVPAFGADVVPEKVGKIRARIR